MAYEEGFVKLIPLLGPIRKMEPVSVIETAPF